MNGRVLSISVDKLEWPSRTSQKNVEWWFPLRILTHELTSGMWNMTSCTQTYLCDWSNWAIRHPQFMPLQHLLHSNPRVCQRQAVKALNIRGFILHNIFSWMEPYLLIWHQASGGKVREKLWHHRLRFDIISFLANFAIMRSDFGGDTWTPERDVASKVVGLWRNIMGYHGCVSELRKPENSRLEHHGTHPSQCRTAA